MNDPWTIMNKRGVPMMQANCGTCGRKVNTFKVNTEDLIAVSSQPSQHLLAGLAQQLMISCSCVEPSALTWA